MARMSVPPQPRHASLNGGEPRNNSGSLAGGRGAAAGVPSRVSTAPDWRSALSDDIDGASSRATAVARQAV